MDDETSYSLVPLSAEHAAPAAELLTVAFCDGEPMTKYLSIPKETCAPFVNRVAAKAVADGISLVALSASGEVASVLILEPQATAAGQFGDDGFIVPEQMVPIFAVLDGLHVGVELADSEKTVHLVMGGTSAAHAGKKLTQRLREKAFRLLLESGFQYVFSESTNPITQHINGKKLDFVEKSAITYTTFEHEGGFPFEELQGKALLMVKTLRK